MINYDDDDEEDDDDDDDAINQLLNSGMWVKIRAGT